MKNIIQRFESSQEAARIGAMRLMAGLSINEALVSHMSSLCVYIVDVYDDGELIGQTIIHYPDNHETKTTDENQIHNRRSTDLH